LLFPVITPGGVVLEGESAEAVTIVVPNGGTGITFGTASADSFHVTVKHLTLKQTAQNQTGIAINALRTRYSHFEDLRINAFATGILNDNTGSTGDSGNSNRDVQFANCTIGFRIINSS